MPQTQALRWTRELFSSSCPCQSGLVSYKCCWRGGGRWYKIPKKIYYKETLFGREKCYLANQMCCEGPISSEHFISRNILKKITKNKISNKLNFQNAAHFFGGNENIEIGIDNFSSNVLCKWHNSILSPLDDVAGVAFENVEKLAEALVRLDEGEKIYRFYLASGSDIERWLVKVFLGLVAAKKIRTINDRIIEIREISPALFGFLTCGDQLPRPLGLYAHSYVGQVRQEGRLSFGTIKITSGRDAVGGMLLSLGFFEFALITDEGFGSEFKEPKFYYHPTEIFDIRKLNGRITYSLTY